MMPILRLGVLAHHQPVQNLTLRVRLSGPEVARLRPQIHIRALPDPEAQRVDPVALLAAGAGLGLFSGAEAAGVHAEAKRGADLAPLTAQWRLLLEGVHPGALRLLANMGANLPCEACEIDLAATLLQSATPAEALPYPGCRRPANFGFCYDRPTKSRGARGVRLALRAPPPDAVLDALLGALDVWANIVMAGAYAAPAGGPAGAFADPATLEEPDVLGISLPVCFGMDEAMFAPLVNLAHRTHALTTPVHRLDIL